MLFETSNGATVPSENFVISNASQNKFMTNKQVLNQDFVGGMLKHKCI